MSLKVVKFGGSSLADGECYKNAAAIVRADPERRYVVVSAPGKRGDEDAKITDMLLKSMEADRPEAIIDQVLERFREIIKELGLELSIEGDGAKMKAAARLGMVDYLASRGEYLSAKIAAALLDYEFVDAGDAIVFDASGRCDWRSSRRRMAGLLKNSRRAVIPGFYGRDFTGEIKTFSRGGSDVTGAIVSDAAGADIYENWTDVSGVLSADPGVVKVPSTVPFISYDELRAFSLMGANVMHEDAVLPVRRREIPINIKNTRRPWEKGTLVLPGRAEARGRDIIGIGCKGGMTCFEIRCENPMAVRNMARVFRSADIPAAYLAADGSRVWAAAEDRYAQGREREVRKALSQWDECSLEASESGLALISAIGKGGAGCGAAMARALSGSGIEYKLIGGAFGGGICAAAAVAPRDRERAADAVYRKLIQPDERNKANEG